ncbi:MAG: hypothetical protein IPN03_10320 [Holophagales bacterium]|nr:hypothetical protein [Holophagales bacterium]
MTLTPDTIAKARSDTKLAKLLSAELCRLLGPGSPSDGEYDAFVLKLRSLPPGLHAMAATYELDVSMALDDLGWHFSNWHHVGFAHETLRGLQELGSPEEAALFQQALHIALAHWDFIGSPTFRDAYLNSPLEKALDPINDRLWVCFGYHGNGGVALVERWVPYARRHPDRVSVINNGTV